MRATAAVLLATAAIFAPGPDLTIRPVPSPAPLNSAQPQLAVGRDGTVLLSWLERTESGAHRFRFSSLAAEGTSWSEPLTIAEGRGFFVNWADVPSMAIADDGLMAAHWMEVSGAGKYAYDVRVSTSTDRGRTWSPPFTPHHDGRPAEHGFGSFFRLFGGGLALAWLDGRTEGQMSLRAARITAGSAGDEMLVDDRVCDCCPTAAIQTARGPVVAYRDRSEDEVRDIYLSRLEDGRWSAARPAVRDNWRIAACPVNGPSMAADGDRVALAWFAAPEGSGRVRVAFSSDGATTFGQPVQLDEGNPLGRVAAVLLPDGDALVGWIEQRQDGAEFLVRRARPDGTRGASIKVATLAAGRASGYPRIARSGSRVVFAWVGNGKVETALAEP